MSNSVKECDVSLFHSLPLLHTLFLFYYRRSSSLLQSGLLFDAYEIDNSLGSMQRTVGGLIEAVYPFEEQVCIVCNEEGKINGLPLNRALRDENGHIYDTIAGTAFICDCSVEDFGSLSSELCAHYMKLFQRPELFLRVDGRFVVVSI